MGVSKIRDFFDHCDGRQILVVGDIMVDRYIWGEVDRISPEAPVPVVKVNLREDRLGGAANVALNLRAMGAEPLLCAVAGHDEAGEVFVNRLADRGIDNSCIVQSSNRLTTVKSRILCRAHQMLRLDEEHAEALEPDEKEALIVRVKKLLLERDIAAIVLQDYNKGVLAPEVIDSVLEAAEASDVPVCVDPKRAHFFDYRGVRLFKPNLEEVRQAVPNRPLYPELESLDVVGEDLAERIACESLMITLSERGVYVRESGKGRILPAVRRKVADVSGAGDTVISLAALGIAGGLKSEAWATLANLAGGQVCEKPGVVPINKEKLLEEALSLARKKR
jgi:rfaE bifunctional protein kinase chain/domain